MIHEIDITKNLTLLTTVNECGYEEVLNDFSNASYINIVTFNISSKTDDLINRLNSVEDNVKTNIITNIPNRWKNYHSEKARENARDRITKYMKKLNPDNFDFNLSTFFCFDNHSKIIMTDNIAYIGSANFSNESQNNIETGVIIRDKKIIEEINSQLIPMFLNESVEYFGSELTEKKLIIINLLSRLELKWETIKQSLYTYTPTSPYDDDFKLCYIPREAYITTLDLEELILIIAELDEILVESNQISNYVDINRNQITNLISETISLIDKKLYDFSKISKETLSSEIWNEKYSILSTEDKLDYYQDKAFQEASYIYENKAENMEEIVESFEINIRNIISQLNEIIGQLTNLDNSDVIDNT